ncbi:DUF2461 domain-containing protein [Prevotella dentasini]|uniref:DUF2461 domain-containing protein n=1 Tax=Prevotella dentasini TaxID=589537 RepID=UPI000469C551|nr:DUF2461 domain-containing protein [Prevotella dentasini]
MNTKLLTRFLTDIAANNNRPWFQEHKGEYEVAKADFEAGIEKAIQALSTFDDEVSHLSVKDCTYRFYRDIRFSPDKSPYKRHFGAYICGHGRKALRGGYYIHVEPGNSLVAVGSYWLPTNILTSCRNEIMGNIDVWRKAVENGKFVKMFGYPNEGEWTDGRISEKGFGLTALKTAPKGFPKDYEYMRYLRMKDYCCWVKVSDDFFEGDKWVGRLVDIGRTGKPMMDFINSIVDDYE